MTSAGEFDAESEDVQATEHPDLYASHAPKRREVSLGFLQQSAAMQSGSLARGGATFFVRPSPEQRTVRTAALLSDPTRERCQRLAF